MFTFISISAANTSVLRWWFKDGNASLNAGDFLSTSLTLREEDNVWEIHISGRVYGRISTLLHLVTNYKAAAMQ